MTSVVRLTVCALCWSFSHLLSCLWPLSKIALDAVWIGLAWFWLGITLFLLLAAQLHNAVNECCVIVVFVVVVSIQIDCVVCSSCIKIWLNTLIIDIVIGFVLLLLQSNANLCLLIVATLYECIRQCICLLLQQDNSFANDSRLKSMGKKYTESGGDKKCNWFNFHPAVNKFSLWSTMLKMITDDELTEI